MKVWVKNFASTASASVIPLAYTFNNGVTLVKDTLKQSIPSGDSVLFSFKTVVNLSVADFYTNVYATTLLANDDYTDNDKLTYSLTALPTYTLPGNEDFEGAKDFWTTGGDNSSWEVGQPYSDSIQSVPSGVRAWKTALYGYHNYNENSYVQSPCFNLQDTSKVIVEFKYYSLQNQGTSGCALQYSTNNGTTWSIVPKHSYPWSWNWYNRSNVPVLGIAGWDSITPGWVTAKQVLPSALLNQGQLKFRFVFKSNDGTPWEGFAFDDFRVYKAPVNIKVDSVTSHVTACQKTNPDKISFHFTNNGIRSLVANKDTLFMAFSVNGGAITHDTIVIGTTIAIGASATATFNKKVNADTPGNYHLEVFHQDVNKGFYPYADNDTVTRDFEIYENPEPGLAANYATARLDTFKIQANINALYLYQWQNATHTNLSTSSFLNAPPAGKSWLTVKYNTASECEVTDTFNVTKLIPDVGVQAILSPKDACELGTAVKMSVVVKNLGTDTLKKNDSIVVAYLDNASTLSKDTFKLSKRFYPGDTLHYATKKNPMNMSAFQTYNISSYTIYKYDSVPGNDNAALAVHTWGYPTVNVGDDDTVAGYDTLRLNNIYKTYLWSDNTTDTFYIARYIGYHKVTVTDFHDCPAKDSAYLFVVAHDISPIDNVLPASACQLSSTEKFTFKFKNIGTDTIAKDEVLTMKYRVNYGTWHTVPYTLPDTLFSGDTLTYQFSQIENMLAVGSYFYEVIGTLPGDIDASNDTLRGTVHVYGYPSLNIGPDSIVEALDYTLNAGAGANRNFLWNNSATTQTINVNTSGIYSVIVTNPLNGCQSFDTANIIIKIKDVSPTLTDLPSSVCEGAVDALSVEIKNNGNYTLSAGTKIYLYSKLNAALTKKDSIVLGSTLAVNGMVYFSYNGLKPQLSIGQNQFTFYTGIDGDLRSNNDTLRDTIQINAIPWVDFGGVNDTILTTPPYLLHAPAGNDNQYTWQNASFHDSVYTVTSSGLYHVTVLNTITGCSDRDTVYVRIFIPDGSITNVLSVPSACIGSLDTIKVEFTNVGNTIMAAGENVLFAYSIGNNTPVTDLYQLTSNLNPGDKLYHTFTGLNSKLTIAKTYNFSFYAIISSDIDNSNDTAYYSILINTKPVVSLAWGADTVSDYTGTQIYSGLGTNYNYLWNTGATTDILTVNTTGTYTQTASQKTTGCANNDSVYVFIIEPDNAVSSVSAPSSICAELPVSVDVVYKNQGNNKELENDAVSINIHNLDNDKVGTDYRYLPNDLLPGESTTFTLSGIDTLLSNGNNNLKVYIDSYVPDIDLTNDTVVKLVKVYPKQTTSLVNTFACDQSSFALPSGKTVSASGTYEDTIANYHGCDSIITINLKMGNTQTFNIDTSICQGNIYISPGGKNCTISGIYKDTLTSFTGCDSIFVVNLTVNPVKINNLTVAICLGNSYNGHTTTGSYSDVFNTYLACDSTVNVDLTVYTPSRDTLKKVICQGDNFKGHSTSGIYTDSLSSIHGCDSIMVYDLVVIPQTRDTINVSICSGNNYKGFTTAGFHTDSLLNINTCDSIVVYNITLLPAYKDTLKINICQGQNYKGHTSTGLYTESLTSISLCDSIVTYDLKVIQPTNDTIKVFICDGQSYKGHTSTGLYTDSLLNTFGCDSIITYNLKVSKQFNDTIVVNICKGQNFKGHTATGLYTDSLTSIAGCDSIITLDLKVIEPTLDTLKISLCNGQNFKGYTTTGFHTDSLTNIFGCDSIIVYNITVLPAYNDTFKVDICQGQIFKGHSSSGLFTESYTTIAGCDSILSYNLFIHQPTKDTIETEICSGQSFKGHNTPGYYTDSLTSIFGCDSIIVYHLAVAPPFKDTLDVYICKGQSYKGFNTSGLYTDSMVTALGCDSIITTNLIVSDSVINNIAKEICPGGSYNGHSSEGLYRDIFQTTAGCDSIVYSQISILSAPTVSLAGGLDTAVVQMPYFLVGGSSGEYTYLWNDNSTDRMLVVDKGGQYKVTVTNPTTSCSTTDSVFLRNKANVIFIEVTKVEGLVDTCSGIKNAVSAELKNVSGSDMTSGSEIKLDVLIDNILKKEGTVTLVSNLPNNGSIVYNFGDISAKLHTGQNIIKVRTNIDGYTGDENSYKTDTIEIWGLPSPVLAEGSSSVEFTNSYLLDAGTGFVSYLWNNNSSNQTYTVTSGGTYWVHVTNTFGCIGGDTVLMIKKNSIKNAEMDKLIAYPNPVNSILNLKIPPCNSNNFSIDIYSSDMRLVTSIRKLANDGFMAVDVANLKNGVYYIKVKSVECTYTEKFIKE